MRFLALVLYLVAALTAAKKPPNILFLMVDEMDGRVLDPDSPQAILVFTEVINTSHPQIKPTSPGMAKVTSPDGIPCSP